MGLDKIKKARFSADYGPSSLFERIKFKMKDVKSLKTKGNHFITRMEERNIPIQVINKIENFNACQWALFMAEVRVDKGKFINSTWEYLYNNKRYWITIGFNNLIETIIIKESRCYDNIVKNGKLYEYVQEVNRELMNEEDSYGKI